MLSPLPRRSGWAYCFAHSPSRISLPRKGCRVGPRIVLFEVCSAFTHVAATLARSPIRDPLNQRLQPFRCLHDCSGCFRLERLPGGTCTHWKSAAFSRRTPGADIEPNSRAVGHALISWAVFDRVGQRIRGSTPNRCAAEAARSKIRHLRRHLIARVPVVSQFEISHNLGRRAPAASCGMLSAK
jgi:hypothetical protein